MYKQTLEKKKTSVVLSILLIFVFVFLVFGLYTFVSVINAITPLYLDPTSVSLIAVMLIFSVVYLFNKASFNGYEYVFNNGVFTVKQFLRKRLINEKSINVDDIIQIKKGIGGKRFYNYGTPYTIVTKEKSYTVAPDKMMLGLLEKKSFTDIFIDIEKDNMFSDLKGLIEIPSIKEEAKENMPFGEPCSKALDYALSLCEKFGFKTKNLDNYCGLAEIGQGEKLIGILCHLDVVPAGDGWDTDPFCAVIKDGEMFGRGAIDDKGPLVAAIYAVNAIKNELKDIPCRIRLIFGCDEESGWECMDRYAKTEEMPLMAFTPDAEYPVITTEKGIAQFVIDGSLSEGRYQLYIEGGMRANMVPDKAKATIIGDIDRLEEIINSYDSASKNISVSRNDDTLTIEATGIGAHGSTPEKGVNAFFELFKFIDAFNLKDSQGKFIKTMLEIFVGKLDGSGASLNLNDEISGSLTLNLGMCFIGKNSVFKDMKDDTLRIVIDVRYPVSYSINDVSSRLQSVLPDSWECDVLHHQAPHHVDNDSKLVETLMAVYKEYTKRDDLPLAIGGGTYARTMPNKAVAFGVQFPDKPDKAHQPNESVNLEDLTLSAKMFACAIKRLIKEEK